MTIQDSSLGLFVQLASRTQKPGVLGTLVSVMPQGGIFDICLGRTSVVRVSVPSVRFQHLYSNNNKHSPGKTDGKIGINLDPCREVEGRLISILRENFLTLPVVSKKVVVIPRPWKHPTASYGYCRGAHTRDGM